LICSFIYGAVCLAFNAKGNPGFIRVREDENGDGTTGMLMSQNKSLQL